MSIPLTLNLRSIVPSNFSVTTMYYKKDDKSAFFSCQLWNINMYLVICLDFCRHHQLTGFRDHILDYFLSTHLQNLSNFFIS